MGGLFSVVPPKLASTSDDRLYFISYVSHKQPVKDNEVVVSDWLPMSRCGMRKFHTGHLHAMNL